MIAKCPCEHCGENIEFASEEFLSCSSVVCPHCGKGTDLYVGIKPTPKTAASAPPPPKKFTTSGAAYQQKSSMKFLPWIMVAVLVVVSGFLAVNFSHEHAQRILLESQLAATEEKLNALKASVADANEKLNTLQANATVANGKLNALQANAAVANRAGVGAEMKQQLAEDQQAVRDAVAGIYEFEPPNLGQTKVLDFRSDGSVVSYYYYGEHSENPYSKKTLTWTSSKNSISIVHGSAYGNNDISFRPEGDDLIDEKGNRWLRIH